jgi:hypothetical protein
MTILPRDRAEMACDRHPARIHNVTKILDSNTKLIRLQSAREECTSKGIPKRVVKGDSIGTQCLGSPCLRGVTNIQAWSSRLGVGRGVDSPTL